MLLPTSPTSMSKRRKNRVVSDSDDSDVEDNEPRVCYAAVLLMFSLTINIILWQWLYCCQWHFTIRDYFAVSYL